MNDNFAENLAKLCQKADAARQEARATPPPRRSTTDTAGSFHQTRVDLAGR